MIIYQSNKKRFIKDLISNEIHEIIEATYKLKTGHRGKSAMARRLKP